MFKQTPSNHLRYDGCPKCSFSKNRSKLESDIILIIREKFPNINIIQSYRPIWLNKKELDLFLPEFNIAIEINGCAYHHSSNEGVSSFYKKTYKEPQYHLNKYELCLKNNIELYHFFEFEDLSSFLEKLELKIKDNFKYKITYCNTIRVVKNLIYYGQSSVELTNPH